MVRQKFREWDGKRNHFCWHHHGGWGGAYGLGFIGAAIYYIQTATTFWGGFVGVLKALVWPAFVVYKLLGI